MKKRGLSTVVTSLILILLVLVALGIVWVVVKNILSQNTDDITTGKFTVNMKIKSVSVDTSVNNISMNIQRTTGQGNLEGFQFIVTNGTLTEVIRIPTNLKEIEEGVFELNLSMNASSVEKIVVVPYYKTSSGKDSFGINKKEYFFKGNEGCQVVSFYIDVDSDGEGNNTVLANISCNSPAPNYVQNNLDCGDNDALINTGATEQCSDGIDNDCDNLIDGADSECGAVNYYCDVDGDLYYNSTISGTCLGSGCEPPNCQLTQGMDCNDGDNSVNPGEIELCDLIDNNCDGQIDEGGVCDISTGLVSHWKFDTENLGVTPDEQGVSDGVPLFGTTLNPTGGYNGQGAYNFDGINDFIDISHHSLLEPASVTITFWFNPSDLNGIETILVKHNNVQGNADGYYVRISGSNLQCQWGNTGVPQYWSNSFSSITGITTGWNFGACTFKDNGIGTDNDLVTYLNGNKGILWTTQYPIYYTQKDLQIGRSLTVNGGSSADHFNGAIDEIRIYNRVLNDAEVNAIFNS